MKEATSSEAVAEFAREVLAETGWELTDVRRRASRLEPPQAYWVIYEVTINKEEEERKLRLVARGAFDTDAWEELREKLLHAGADRPCDPIQSIGYPRIFDETQHAYWFFPFDLSLPGLPYACDAETMWRVLTSLSGRTLGRHLQIQPRHVGGPHAEQGKPTVVQAIHEFIRAGRGVHENTQPRERIHALVNLQLIRWDGWLADAVRSVAPRDEIARHLVREPIVLEADLRQARIKISNADVVDLEEQGPIGRVARADQILHHFVLPVDCDGAAAGQVRQRNPVALAAERDVDAFVPQPFA